MARQEPGPRRRLGSLRVLGGFWGFGFGVAFGGLGGFGGVWGWGVWV